jgi:hypothetical protein
MQCKIIVVSLQPAGNLIWHSSQIIGGVIDPCPKRRQGIFFAGVEAHVPRVHKVQVMRMK